MCISVQLIFDNELEAIAWKQLRRRVSGEFCDTSGFDSEVGQRKGSAKVRHCQQQRSYCVLREADDESDVLGMSP